MIKKIIYTALFFSFISNSFCGSYQNVIRSTEDRSTYNSCGSILLEALLESNVAITTKISIGGRVNGGTISRSDTVIDAGSFEDVSHDLGLTLSAGDELTILISRNDTTSGTGTLQIKNVILRYNDSMNKE